MDKKRERRRATEQRAPGGRPARQRPARPDGGVPRARRRSDSEPRGAVPQTDAPETRGEPDPADLEPDIDRESDPAPPEGPPLHGGRDALTPDDDPLAGEPVPDDERATWGPWEEDDRG